MRVHNTLDGHGQFYGLTFKCPGCEGDHTVNVNHPVPDGLQPSTYNAGRHTWSFNGDYERPTLNPSVLVRTGHYAPGHAKDHCYCTFEARFGYPPDFKCGVCHSFVRDGMIQFLDDCTHKLRGQTVPLPEYHMDTHPDND